MAKGRYLVSGTRLSSRHCEQNLSDYLVSPDLRMESERKVWVFTPSKIRGFVQTGLQKSKERRFLLLVQFSDANFDPPDH